MVILCYQWLVLHKVFILLFFNCCCCLVDKSCLTLATPWTVVCQALLFVGFLQAKMLGWVANSFSRGDFPTQGSNLCPLHCRRILYR